MRALLVSGDLMLVSAAQGAADRRHADLETAENVDAALEACREDPPAVAIIDLRLAGLDVAEFVKSIRRASNAITIIACGPHVHEAALAAAKAAGCDAVFTRGEFDRRVDEVFEKFTPRAGGPHLPR